MDEVGYHDLMADLKKAGCPVCHGAQRAAWKYLDGLLWEFVNDPGVRAGFRAARGFCREHSRMALVVASEQSAGGAPPSCTKTSWERRSRRPPRLLGPHGGADRGAGGEALGLL
jgi:hypothetical protein